MIENKFQHDVLLATLVEVPYTRAVKLIELMQLLAYYLVLGDI